MPRASDMPDLTKIATCSYCGTRSVLRLAGKVQHELACGACGARLHTMKPMRQPGPAAPATSTKAPTRRPKPAPRRKTSKRRKPLISRLADFIEDIVDEIEDVFD